MPIEAQLTGILALSGKASAQVLRSVAAEIAAASREGVEVAVVVGGGNFFRGINAWDGLERATADYMGMLATCMNAICLQVRSPAGIMSISS